MRQQQRGFVLLLTLWVLVIVTMAAAYFGQRVQSAVELAQQSRQNTQALIDMASTRAEIVYRLSCSTFTEYGLSRGNTTIYLDDRPYQGLGSTLLQIQDTRGLVNLNFIDDARLNLFLGQLNVAPEQRAHLIDTLRDYTDADNLHRLNGAEADDYRALGLPPPTNRALVSPWQAKQIIGWRSTLQLWQDNRLARLASISQSMGINPNTAPAEVLATIPGVNADMAQIIMARRRILPFTHDWQIEQITGVSHNLPMGMGIVATPSDTLRITQSAAGLAWAIQYNLKLTPIGPNAPWRTDYYTRIPTVPTTPDSITPLPPRSIAPPDKYPAFLSGG